MTDLHHGISMTRRFLITPGMYQLLKFITKDSHDDMSQFGENFLDQIKTATEVEKSGKELRKLPPKE